MGAMCGKTRAFGGEGHQLNQLPTPSPQAPGSQQPKPNPGLVVPVARHEEEDGTARRAAAEAAEKRAQAAKSRGTKGGEISKQLSRTPADGGRVDQAIAAGGTDQKPLVWD